jgi:hypothetical protein
MRIDADQIACKGMRAALHRTRLTGVACPLWVKSRHMQRTS